MHILKLASVTRSWASDDVVTSVIVVIGPGSLNCYTLQEKFEQSGVTESPRNEMSDYSTLFDLWQAYVKRKHE